MAFTYRSSTSAGNASGGAVTINKPSGVASGDLLIVAAYLESDTNTWTPGSGFTSLGSQVNTGLFSLQVWYRWADGTEPASWSWTPASSNWRTIVCAAWSGGAGSGAPLDVSAGAQGDGDIVSNQLAPSVTTTAADDLLLFVYGNYAGVSPGDTTGAATNMRVTLGGLTIGDATIASAGATGTSSPDSGVGTEDWAGLHIAVFAGTPGINGTSAVTLDGLTAASTGTVSGVGSSGTHIGKSDYPRRNSRWSPRTLRNTRYPRQGIDVEVSRYFGVPADVGITGASAVTLDALTPASAGTVAIAGASAVPLGGLTPASAGTVRVAGASAITLDALTAASTGTVGSSTITGASAVTLDSLTPSSAGAVRVSGASAITLDALTPASAGAVGIAGQSAVTLGALTPASAGTVRVAGASAVTLDAITPASAGAVRVAGASAVTLDGLTAASTGIVGAAPITGASAVTLDALTAASAGGVRVSGASAVTLDSVTPASAGAVTVSGASAVTYGGLVVASAGAVRVTGASAVTLGGVLPAGTATVLVVGSSGVTLDPLTGEALGAVRVSGQSGVVLAELVAVSTGTVGGALSGIGAGTRRTTAPGGRVASEPARWAVRPVRGTTRSGSRGGGSAGVRVMTEVDG